MSALSGNNTVDQLVDQNANQRSLAPEAVGTQVLLMTIVSLATVVVFNVLRPSNRVIYEPKIKYHVGDKQPPRIGSGLFGWVSPLLHTKEAELIDKVGLDAATFLRFLRMFRWFFTLVAILTCAILLPVNIVYNLKNVKSDDRTVLSMLTIRDVTGNLLFVHVGATYVITFIAMGFVWMHWKDMVRLRQEWYRSPDHQKAFYARTLAVTKVPRKLQSDDGIREIFASCAVPYPTTSVHIGHKVGKLPELIEYHNQTVRQFEQVLVKYLKGGHIAKERPSIRVGGFLGIGGKKYDAIDFYTAKLQRTEGAIQEFRNLFDTRKPENYGFASMAAVPYAHIVARILQNKHPKGTTIALAPNPKDIIWENMNRGPGELARKRTFGWFLLFLVSFMNTIPLFALSILANLSALAGYVGFLNNWQNQSHATFVIISGVLPPAVSAIFGFFLPIVMRYLSKYQGAMTHSRLDRAVVARYFTFLVISQLVIFTLIGVVFISIQQIVAQIGQHQSFKDIITSDNIKRLPATINQTYIEQSSYWLTFFPLRGFLVFFDLAQIINLFWISFKTRVFGRTPRDIREWTQPPEFQYAIYYSNMLFMGTVAFVFAPLAPLVVVAAAVVFWFSSWVYKYQLMFVYTTKVETGGRLWNVVINRFLVGIILMQVLMILTIGLQQGFKTFTWVATIPPVIFVIIFKSVINKKFDAPFRTYNPTDEEIRNAKVHSERADNKGNRLEKRFGHPALHMELFTPMLHAKMMPLLADVYKGRIGDGLAQPNEYGGRAMEANILPGGIKIAAVQERELEYDPAQWQRERIEDNWDAKSMASTNILGSDGASTFYGKYDERPASPAPPLPFLERYRQEGPHAGLHTPNASHTDIELSRFDSRQDQLPLLYSAAPIPQGGQPYYDHPPQGYPSHGTPPPMQRYASNEGSVHGSPVMAPQHPPHSQQTWDSELRQAPVHRPYPSQAQGHARSPSQGYPPSNYPPGGNMAGRGAGGNY